MASTVAAQTPHFDPEPFERIEARISALARQIEEVAEDRPGGEVIERLNLLSQRVDEIAARTAMPEKAIERLATQIAVIADKIDRAPPLPDADEIFPGIEQRFDVLSGLLERRQGDALEQGNLLFRDLERRLDEVADRLDQRQTDAALDSAGIMDAIDARFAALAQRLESGKPDGAGDAAIRGLEARLEDISERLDAVGEPVCRHRSRTSIRNLEAQVAGLSAHLAAAERAAAGIRGHRAAARRNREVDRRQPRNASWKPRGRPPRTPSARSPAAQAESAAVAGLAEDLKALETLTRRSDERNAKTFEAIHDTLLKIVDRLGSLESEAAGGDAADRRAAGRRARWRCGTRRRSTPTQTCPLATPIGRMPAPRRRRRRRPASSARRRRPPPRRRSRRSAPTRRRPPEAGGRVRSMFGGLTRAFGGKKERGDAAACRIDAAA